VEVVRGAGFETGALSTVPEDESRRRHEGQPPERPRDLRSLPKAHLHLHFTGSMRHATLLELAARDGVQLPDSLVSEWPPQLSAADEKGWFRFQRLYDVARSVLRTEDDVRRLVREAAEDDVRDGGRWLEIQVDPSGYGARFGGITAFTELVLDAVRDASTATGLGIAVVIAANRTRHPLDARTLARLAAQYAGRGVVGFGLSNDERRGVTTEFAPAFAIAERAGLLLDPHGGELLGPASVRTVVEALHAQRIGHGVRSVEDPELLAHIVDRGITLEVCPVSNVALGVYSDLTSVPLPDLLDAGATVALGADDPLLFGSRLAGQYATMRAAHGLEDDTLAELAAMSIRASCAPDETKSTLLAEVAGWLAAAPTSATMAP
jgi:adenosine deaminase